MANPRSSKRQLEKNRQEKAAAKRERRRTHPDAAEPGEEADDESQGDLLARLAELHERYARGGMSFEAFDEEKADLTSRLRFD
jgi:hypothetical protein